MRQIFLYILLLLTQSILAQQPATKPLDIDDKDLSSVWLSEHPRFYGGEVIPKAEPVGFFGENYWRFYIHFISIVQNPENTKEYFLYGKNMLKGNICEIQGTLVIESAEVFVEEYPQGVQEGVIIGTYELYEDQKKPGTGKFIGSFKTYVMLSDNQIQYSTLDWYSDGFMNNQFEGTWTSYSSDKSYICNWGDYRIPNREVFDIGASQMGVNPKFVKNGWENFELATLPFVVASTDEEREQIKNARLIELVEWWK